jgi:hypothetical protein
MDHVAQFVTTGAVAHLEKHALRTPEPTFYRNYMERAMASARLRDAETYFVRKLKDFDEPTAPFGVLEIGEDACAKEAHDELERSLTQCVRRLTRRVKIAQATLFHAAWGLVIAQNTGRSDVVFGSVVLSGPHNIAALRSWALFSNVLPLRLQLASTSIGGLIEQTQSELGDLLEHEHSSLAVAHHCSGIVGSTPLFSSVLQYRHGVPTSGESWENAGGIRVLAALQRTHYPITLTVDDLCETFSLTAQTDQRIDPNRVLGDLYAAILFLTKTLGTTPQTPALAFVSQQERESPSAVSRPRRN